MSVFEIIMLCCFGAAWPASIYRSYKARTARGKSLMFLVVILVGYVAGMLHKVFYSYDFVIYLYGINFIMVFIDMLIWFRNRKLDREAICSQLEKDAHSV
ncbi:MAG: hypothetical protein WCP73_10260 [Eubacteriales bacterium]